jgi:opacity protein-like surface antigen
MIRLALIALLLFAGDASAQTALQRRALQPAGGGSWLELTGFGGVRLPKDLYAAGGAHLGLDGGKTFGGRVGWHPNTKLGIELSYARQKGDLTERSGTTGFASPAPFGTLVVHQADVAALLSQATDPRAKTAGFMVVGAGATRFAGDVATASGSAKATRFAWLVGLGTKIRMGEKTALRLEGRYRNTHVDRKDEVVYTDTNGNEYRYAPHWYRTGELTAGITLRL